MKRALTLLVATTLSVGMVGCSAIPSVGAPNPAAQEPKVEEAQLQQLEGDAVTLQVPASWTVDETYDVSAVLVTPDTFDGYLMYNAKIRPLSMFSNADECLESLRYLDPSVGDVATSEVLPSGAETFLCETQANDDKQSRGFVAVLMSGDRADVVHIGCAGDEYEAHKDEMLKVMSSIALKDGQKPSFKPAGETESEGSTQEPTVPAAPEQEQALELAEGYLRVKGYSKKRLLHQLTSEHGEGLPEDVAQYAVDHLNVDWKEQAYRAGGTILTYGSYSKQELYDRLTSETGDQFTPEEAQYAVDKLFS